MNASLPHSIISQIPLVWTGETLTAKVWLLFFSSLVYSHALCSPAYLPEHVDHVDCSGGCCARGVINGMMQRPVLLHPGPHTCTPPSFIYHLAIFVNEICCEPSGVSRLTDAERAMCAVGAGLCVCVCARELAQLTTETCRTYRMYANRFPCAKRQSINLCTFFSANYGIYLYDKGYLQSLALASQTISSLCLNILIINNNNKNLGRNTGFVPSRRSRYPSVYDLLFTSSDTIQVYVVFILRKPSSLTLNITYQKMAPCFSEAEVVFIAYTAAFLEVCRARPSALQEKPEHSCLWIERLIRSRF